MFENTQLEKFTDINPFSLLRRLFSHGELFRWKCGVET
jgi:hypothetical protein